MRVTCPSCAAVYDIPEPMLGARARTLRCGRCMAEWTLPVPDQEEAESAVPPAELPEIEAEPVPPADERLEPRLTLEPLPEPVPALAIPEGERPFVRVAERAAPPQEPRNGAAWLGWIASLVLLALLAWGGYAYRDAVMHAWPPSERLYTLLGLMAPHQP